ncbi:MAG: recombinase family protein [Oxalobacteraceae bacterium]|nr:MAG: recombinase family protein [Oxalobacteraceae bacterium]
MRVGSVVATQVVAYVRVSSIDQNLGRQLEHHRRRRPVFEEKVSGGSRTDRVALLGCIRYVHEGDVVKVASMDRLARSLTDLRETVDEITGKVASVVFMKEQQTYNRDTDDAISGAGDLDRATRPVSERLTSETSRTARNGGYRS